MVSGCFYLSRDLVYLRRRTECYVVAFSLQTIDF